MKDQHMYDAITRAVKSAIRDCLKNLAHIAPEAETTVPSEVLRRWPKPEEAQDLVQNEIDYINSQREETK